MKHGRVAANRLLSDPEQEPRYRVYLGKCLYPFVRREVVVRLRLDSCVAPPPNLTGRTGTLRSESF